MLSSAGAAGNRDGICSSQTTGKGYARHPGLRQLRAVLRAQRVGEAQEAHGSRLCTVVEVFRTHTTAAECAPCPRFPLHFCAACVAASHRPARYGECGKLYRRCRALLHVLAESVKRSKHTRRPRTRAGERAPRRPCAHAPKGRPRLHSVNVKLCIVTVP